MTFDEWLRVGMDNGWCGPAVCAIHDGLPTTAGEDQALEMGDPCIHVVRLYDEMATKEMVEANHAPSVWRKPWQ